MFGRTTLEGMVSGRIYRDWGRLGLVTLLVGYLPVATNGQVIQGRLLDARSDLPIPAGRIVVVDSAFTPLTSTLTDPQGRFSVRLEEPSAEVMVYATALSYRSYVDGPFQVGRTDTLHVEFRIEPHPLEVDSLAVTVEGRRRRLEIAGFYQRQADEPGAVFLDRSDVERRPSFRASGVFRRIAGVSVVPLGMDAWIVLLRNRCVPRLLIDGVEVRSQSAGGVRIDDLVTPMEIEGVEIYRSAAQTPLQFGGTIGPCGVILIWTR